MRFITLVASAILVSEQGVQAINWKRGKNRIYDADGDGVQDNIDKTASELDDFYDPAVYGWVEDI